MKKILFFLSIIVLVGSIFVFVELDPSRKIYLEALALHESGKDRVAYQKVQEAMEINKLNRKAILLQAKLHKIVTSEDNYNAAVKAYRESMLDVFNEEYLLAVNKIANSYDLLSKIPTDAPIFPKADKLQENVDRELDRIRKALPDLYFKKAKELADRKQYAPAYEYLLRMDPEDKRVIQFKSQLSYKIGTERYAAIMARTEKITDHEIADAIYWLSNVDESSSSIVYAKKQIQVLQKLQSEQRK